MLQMDIAVKPVNVLTIWVFTEAVRHDQAAEAAAGNDVVV